MTEPLDLELRLADVKAKQGTPARASFGSRRRGEPGALDAATRAAGDYDAEDLAASRPAPPPKVPDELRQYLVAQVAPDDTRLARSERQIAGTKEDPILIGNKHGWLGCDWAGLYRMADARRRAGLPIDELDVEALKRGDTAPIETPCPPPSTAASSSSSSAAPPAGRSSSPSTSSPAS